MMGVVNLLMHKLYLRPCTVDASCCSKIRTINMIRFVSIHIVATNVKPVLVLNKIMSGCMHYLVLVKGFSLDIADLDINYLMGRY